MLRVLANPYPKLKTSIMAVDKATYNWTDESLPSFSVEAAGNYQIKPLIMCKN